jgi:hypothetical protein
MYDVVTLYLLLLSLFSSAVKATEVYGALNEVYGKDYLLRDIGNIRETAGLF